MEIKRLSDAELLNISLLLSDMQQSVISEIKNRPLMGKATPILVHLEVANKAATQVNRFILDAFSFKMACGFGEASDEIFSKITDIILLHKQK